MSALTLPGPRAASIPPVLDRRDAPPAVSVMGVRFDALETDEAARRIVGWAEAGEARYACFSNAHGVVEALDDPAFQAVLNGADLNLPDGMSVVRSMRTRGLEQDDRVYGPDLTLAVARRAAEAGVPVAFYGSTSEVLESLADRLPAQAPGLRIVEAISPPFRPLSSEEDAALIEQLRQSGARIVFVGLGCPRQERWCAEHAGQLDAVLLGVGAAFDFHAGTLRQAPRWVQRSGLEWAFRLVMEPRRLWRRYARVVPRFLAGDLRERASIV